MAGWDYIEHLRGLGWDGDLECSLTRENRGFTFNARIVMWKDAKFIKDKNMYDKSAVAIV